MFHSRFLKCYFARPDPVPRVIVIAHLAPRMDQPVVALAGLRQCREPRFAVGVIVIDVLTPVTARGDVIETTGNFETKGTSHYSRIASEMLYCKT